MSSTKLNWGILGTGNIARRLAKAIRRTGTAKLVAVASREQARADAFARKFGSATAYGSYDALLADPAVQAVYVALPHPFHLEWSLKAAETGKHILCEKPLCMNAGEAMLLADHARRHGVFLMEAFMYRCHPQTLRLVELIREGAIGKVTAIDASFGFASSNNPEDRLHNPALGGGAILDLGCYPMSLARLVAGVATGTAFAEPIQTKATAQLGPTGVDEHTEALLVFPDNIVAHLAASLRSNLPNVACIHGTEGRIELPKPWFCRGLLRLVRGGDVKTVRTEGRWTDLYSYELNAVAKHLKDGEAPQMSPKDSIGNLRAMDGWRSQINVRYPGEHEPRANHPIILRQPKPPVPTPARLRARIPALGRDVSRLIMGTVAPNNIPYAFALFDDYFERGGNAFDTSPIYGAYNAERLLGAWVNTRKVRDDVLVFSKGLLDPLCWPQLVEPELKTSLDRMKLDYVDLYVPHRDNTRVPAGEFVEALARQQQAGRIRGYALSNWSLPRVEEAISYAKANGLPGPAAVSNQFSLAHMIKPLWSGCFASRGAAWEAFLKRTELPLLGWSAQARGFFEVNQDAHKIDFWENAEAWADEGNFERRRRAQERARQLGVSPSCVALAWTLHQPGVWSIIGPVSLQETADSFRALDLNLSPDDFAWLDLAPPSTHTGD